MVIRVNANSSVSVRHFLKFSIMANTLNFASVLTAICEIVLEFLNLNDVPVGVGEYHLVLPSSLGEKEKPYAFLANQDGTKRYRCSMAQLAAMRVYQGAVKDLKCEWSKDFKSAANCLSFQELVRKSNDAAWLEKAKFTCVAQLKVQNSSFEAATPVYKRTSYKGFDDYKERMAKLKKEHGSEWFETVDARVSLKDLRKVLETSGLKDGEEKPENLVLVPVFVVS